jgi:hypothetical protein
MSKNIIITLLEQSNKPKITRIALLEYSQMSYVELIKDVPDSTGLAWEIGWPAAMICQL